MRVQWLVLFSQLDTMVSFFPISHSFIPFYGLRSPFCMLVGSQQTIASKTWTFSPLCLFIGSYCSAVHYLSFLSMTSHSLCSVLFILHTFLLYAWGSFSHSFAFVSFCLLILDIIPFVGNSVRLTHPNLGLSLMVPHFLNLSHTVFKT
jgi:hypothetical protein